MALHAVPVGSANGAQPPAIFPAKAFHRDRKDHLLADHIGKRDSVTREKANAQFVLWNFDLFFARDVLDRPVRQVEIPLNRNFGRGQATVATGVKPGPQMPSDTDFIPRQFGHRLHIQRSGLLEIRLVIIHRPGSVAPGNYDPVALQLC